MNKNLNYERTLVRIVIAVGILLSITQFIYNRSIWRDEASLALNIINRSNLELFKPLDFLQIAPILFLQLEKIFSLLVPNSEFGLRLLPLLSYLFSLFFFYKILKIIQANNYAIILALSLFIFNANVIYYSSEIKQYMCDVLILTSIYYLVLRNYKNKKVRYFVWGTAGIISVFLSNVSPIILSTVGLYILYDNYKNERKDILNILGVFTVWASSFLLYFFLFIHNHPSYDEQVTNFSPGNVFMPANPLTRQFYTFVYTKVIMIFNTLLKFGVLGGAGLFALTLAGIVFLAVKRRMDLLILIVTPLLLHFLLSGFKLYPFKLRLVLYMCPLMLLPVSFGFSFAIEMLASFLKNTGIKIISIAIPVFLFIFLFKHGFPVKHIEIKESIRFIEKNKNENDRIYVDCWSERPYMYYNQISFVKVDSSNIIYGKYHDEYDTLKFRENLSLLHGRIWLLFATDLGRERLDYAVNYYRSKGDAILKEQHDFNSDVCLVNIVN